MKNLFFNKKRKELLNNILWIPISTKDKSIADSMVNTELPNHQMNKFKNLSSVEEIILKYQEDDFPEIGRILIEEDRLDDCLALTDEIYNSEKIWEDGVYSSYFEPICKTAIRKNNLEFLDDINLVANQWLKCENWEYSKTFDEMIAHETPLIMDTYIKLAKINNNDSKKIIQKSLHFFNSFIHVLKDTWTDLYLSTCHDRL